MACQDLRRDIQAAYEYTEDNPFEVADPTYIEIPRNRVLADDSERPSADTNMAELLDGRELPVTKALPLAYFVAETNDEADTLLDDLAALEGCEVWVRETPQEGDDPYVYGGEQGMIVTVDPMSQGNSGFAGSVVRFSGFGINGRTLRILESNLPEIAA